MFAHDSRLTGKTAVAVARVRLVRSQQEVLVGRGIGRACRGVDLAVGQRVGRTARVAVTALVVASAVAAVVVEGDACPPGARAEHAAAKTTK